MPRESTHPPPQPAGAPSPPRQQAARADAPGPAAAAGGLTIQLRSFARDRAALDQACALLSSLPECQVRRALADDAADFGATECRDGGTPDAVVLVADAAGAARAGVAISALQQVRPGFPVFVLTQGVADTDLSALVGRGAADFASLSCSDAELQLRLRRTLGLQPLDPAGPAATGGPDRLDALRSRLIGDAPLFVRLVSRVPVIAASDASVLLYGETGTGKEVFAEAIHYQSTRSRGPWVAINCAAIPPELVEDELFGHVRGAYTNALGARSGLVREAQGGTLFLDEIDSMPLAAQAKLLRFLQDKQYRAVGASQVHTADVRVIAASTLDLRLAAATGRFRADLYFRLAVLCLLLPPLRERRSDIALLARHFLAQFSREARRTPPHVTPAAWRVLHGHDWPGNVRELKHALQRALLLCEGPALQSADIELDGIGPIRDDPPQSFREAKAHAVQNFERQYLESLLKQSGGNISRAARSARKNRRALFELLRRHGIDAERFRARE